MPTNRTRRSRGMRSNKGYGSLSEARLHYLWWGMQIYDWDFANWTDDEEIKLCWELHREQIMAEWMSKQNNAGKRPWSWWWYEHGCKAPESLGGQPREAQLLLDMGELQPWEIEKFNEWNEPLINLTNIAASDLAARKGDNNRAEQS